MGHRSLAQTLAPAERIAERGFTVDATFRQQTAANLSRFADFPATAKLFLPGGKLPAIGSTLTNPDLARTYRELAERGVGVLYHGEIGSDIIKTVRNPLVSPTAKRTVRPGTMNAAAPAIVLHDGAFDFAIGSPGGATIITTVLQVFLGHVDRGLPLVDAIAAPASASATARRPTWNPPCTTVHYAVNSRRSGITSAATPRSARPPECNACPMGRWLAAAERVRRGGGSAMVVDQMGS